MSSVYLENMFPLTNENRKSLKEMCGIYGIRNKVNRKIYVGQSIKIKSRIQGHIRDLRQRKHANSYLQDSYNKHGPSNFECIILEECETIILDSREQYWIDHFRYIGSVYNSYLCVENLRGERNPFFGKRHSDEARIKMSQFKKEAYVGEGNPNYGKKSSNEVRLKMSEGLSKQLNRDKVQKIATMLRDGRSHQEIAGIFGIGRTTVTRISNGARWTNVTGGPVIPVIHDENGVRQFTSEHRKRIGNKRLGRKHTLETRQLMRIKALDRKNRGAKCQ